MKIGELVFLLSIFFITFAGANSVFAADNITAGNNDFGSYGEDNACLIWMMFV